MQEVIENIEIVFKLCRKPDAECIVERENILLFKYDDKKTARFILNERKKDYLIEIACLKTETPFFANEFVPKWQSVIDKDLQIGNVYGNLEQ
ncbi:hypothetical protein C3K47_16305 [Solitalea longa]|uniref:Uncharacterized protein n=1 Tax=Solitalea longa TaxID=2079460 RepID=A0A2S4ZXR4_9SPHI|nr:hypothetical protein [Solitalea longa]POY35144.1 hypothetical protein C3K47_16305 [Solitalea longa]